MYKLSKYSFSFAIILFLFALCGAFTIISAQDNSSQTSDKSNSNANLNPDTTPTPVPFSEVIGQAESTSTTLKELASGTAADPASEVIKRDLPKITDQIDAKLVETSTLLSARPSLERLRTFETEWNSLTKSLPDWKDQLAARGKALDNDLKQLDQIEEKWKKTKVELQGQDVPPQVATRIDEILATTTQLRNDLEAARADTIALQGRVVEQQDRAKEALDSIKQSRDSLVGRLLVRDSPPIWSPSLWQGLESNISTSAATTFSPQINDLRTFIAANGPQIGAHLAIFLLFALALFVVHKRTRSLIENEPELKNAAVIFSLPVPTAFVIAIFAYPWIYSQTPQILKAIFGAAVLIPTVIIVRKLVERPIYPILYSLVVFYFIDQFRIIIEALPGLFRVVFMIEMLGGALFFSWIYFGKLERDETEEIVYGSLFKTIKTAAIIAVPIFVISFLANIFGFVGFARLTGNAVLKSAYAAVILYAAVRILDGLLIFALRLRPLNMLGMVKNSRALIQHKLRIWLRWIVFILWILISLDLLALRDPLFNFLRSVFGYDLSIGSFTISLGDVAAFIVTVFAAFMISRFVRFVLNEDVYPRTALARGLPYAISTVLNYVILLIGFFLALAVIGLDLTKFTILAGAFGVGIGFGLQNIVNNFVSGLILLFERPVNVGDTVEVGTDEGDLVRIGLRASVLRTFQGSEVIVPNGELISNRVVNWTLTDQQRRIEIEVGVAYGSDPHKVIELLTKVASANTKILKSKPARTIFTGFGASSLDFQVRVWTDRFEEWVLIRSEIALAIHDALYQAGIEIPFPQTDLHVRSVPAGLRMSDTTEEKETDS